MTPLQREMDDVVGVLRANMGKVLERDLKLADLEDKAEGLADGAKTFQRTSKKLKRSQWWANARWTIYAVLIGIGLIAAVVCSESPATGLAPLLSDVRGVGPLPVGTLGRCIVALTLTSTSAGFVGAPCNWHVRQYTACTALNTPHRFSRRFSFPSSFFGHCKHTVAIL